MKTSEPFRQELFRLLDSSAEELIAPRAAFRAAQIEVQGRYEMICILATYLRKHGVDVQLPEPPPQRFGVRKTRRLERERINPPDRSAPGEGT